MSTTSPIGILVVESGGERHGSRVLIAVVSGADLIRIVALLGEVLACAYSLFRLHYAGQLVVVRCSRLLDRGAPTTYVIKLLHRASVYSVNAARRQTFQT